MTDSNDDVTLPVDPDRVRREARAVLDANWRPEGYTVPNANVYPFQWLWDSCFHAIVWSQLGEPVRARSELAHLFRTQDAQGFVPHVDYEFAPDHHARFWGRTGSSSITQPPMFGHAIAEFHRRGIDVADLVGPATAGLRFLLDVRERVDGLVALCHPWESGGDDCPRWDHWCTQGWSKERWYEIKGELVGSIRFDSGGSPVGNPDFVVGSCGFNALVVFNARELASVTGDADLRRAADSLAATLAARWDRELATWIDTGASATTSGRIRSLDAMLPVLVEDRADVLGSAFAEIVDDRRFGGACGPAGVHREEPTFAPRTYWRGPAWPQLTYLLWVAARRAGRVDDARSLAEMLVRGAMRSQWAEYWDPDDGAGLGAAPQSWAALAALVV